jgi:hypothetical protein
MASSHTALHDPSRQTLNPFAHCRSVRQALNRRVLSLNTRSQCPGRKPSGYYLESTVVFRASWRTKAYQGLSTYEIAKVYFRRRRVTSIFYQYPLRSCAAQARKCGDSTATMQDRLRTRSRIGLLVSRILVSMRMIDR